MLVILDRDGVINHYQEGDYVCHPDEWVPLPGSLQAIADLTRAGHQVAIATNQSGIARGYYSHATLAAIHNRLNQLVQELGGDIAHIAYCPHHPDADCDCRKPRTGLLEQIRDALGLPGLTGSYMVGDNLKDLEAGVAMGCRPVLVRTGSGRTTEENLHNTRPLPGLTIYDDLAAFTQDLLVSGKGTS
ncbi:D-glycero-beta-D-manno-heptose 1,7-bisphosphate 7-phosphatase [Marinobacteraceae bacterium S3BR75-40.1]